MPDILPAPNSAEKPDWIASTMGGKLVDLDKEGVAAEDFDIKDADYYWSKPKVRSYFKDQQGAERKDLFDNFYSYQADRYNRNRSGQMAVKNFINQPLTHLNKQLGTSGPRTVASDIPADPYGRSYIFGSYTDPKYSMKENAISRGVKVAPGKYVPLEEFGGERRLAKNADASYKLDDEGRPYFEPLKKADRMRSFDEDYSPTWDFAGNYGYNYNIGNSLFSVLKNPINGIMD